MRLTVMDQVRLLNMEHGPGAQEAAWQHAFDCEPPMRRFWLACWEYFNCVAQHLEVPRVALSRGESDERRPSPAVMHRAAQYLLTRR